MRLTKKQVEIMKVVIAKNPDGSSVDFDQLIERVSYETTKDSMHFSVRALINKGLIFKDEPEKRRDRQRTIITPTVRGFEALVEAGVIPSSRGFLLSASETSLMEELDGLA